MSAVLVGTIRLFVRAPHDGVAVLGSLRSSDRRDSLLPPSLDRRSARRCSLRGGPAGWSRLFPRCLRYTCFLLRKRPSRHILLLLLLLLLDSLLGILSLAKRLLE